MAKIVCPRSGSRLLQACSRKRFDLETSGTLASFSSLSRIILESKLTSNCRLCSLTLSPSHPAWLHLPLHHLPWLNLSLHRRVVPQYSHVSPHALSSQANPIPCAPGAGWPALSRHALDCWSALLLVLALPLPRPRCCPSKFPLVQGA